MTNDALAQRRVRASFDAPEEKKEEEWDTNAKLKSMFVYNFTKYFEWPQYKMDTDSFQIAFIGEKSLPIHKELKKLAETKKVGRLPLKIKLIENILDLNLKSCQMLYVGRDKCSDIDKYMSTISDNGILLVTDDCISEKSMINFVEVNRKLKFTINTKRVWFEKIKVSSALLSLGIEVKDDSYYNPIKVNVTIPTEELNEATPPSEEPNTDNLVKVTASSEKFEVDKFTGIKPIVNEAEFKKDFAMLFDELEDHMSGSGDEITLNKKELSLMINEHSKQKQEIFISQKELLSVREETELKLKELELSKSELKELNIEKLEKEKEIDRKQKTLDSQSSLISSQKTVIYGFIFFLVIIVVLVFFGYRQYRKTQLANALIQKQKHQVEIQKELVEEKQKEILDSINYAKRIQSAILPPLKLVKEHLENSFILYKPKDIVAGDFYWMETIQCANVPISQLANSPSPNQLILFAAADCTGHGVPGAMVSVVCNNALNRAVREFGLTDPGEILNKTRDLVISEFEKSDEDVKDGMDISLVSLAYIIESGKRKATIKWAGANNPLWIVRAPQLRSTIEQSQYHLEEVKADKQPIGKYGEPKPFNTHSLELFEGDSIYIFTDGYQDQFGGEKGKKFKASQLKELILKLQSNPMDEQYQELNNAFENWKANKEQVDDVCIIGVRI